MTDINTNTKKHRTSSSPSGNRSRHRSPFPNQMEHNFVYNHGIPPPMGDFHTPIPAIMFMPHSNIPNGSSSRNVSTSRNTSRSEGSEDNDSIEEVDMSPNDQFNQMMTNYPMHHWPQPMMPIPMGMISMMPLNGKGQQMMQPQMFNFIPPIMPDGSYNFMMNNPAVNNFTYKGVNNGMSKYAHIPNQIESVGDFEGELYEMSTDHQGSRLLQDIMTVDDLAMIKNELLSHATELSIDPFGNYFIQKWIEIIPDIEGKIELIGAIVGYSEDQVPKLSGSINPQTDGLLSIAYNSHGTRTLQMAVSELRNNQQGIDFLKTIFENRITLLSVDLNGNHVVQELLSSLKSDYLDFVIDQIENNIVKIVTEKHGCCVAQRAIDSGNAKQKNQLCTMILKDTIKFTKDPYGNYVIQYIMQKEKDLNSLMRKKLFNKSTGTKHEDNYTYSMMIIQNLLTELNELCFHKYGSNVIENAMKLPNKETVEVLFEELVNIFKNGHEKIFSFLTDAYANYVLQTSLLVSQKHTKEVRKDDSGETYFDKFVSLLKPVITSELDKLHEQYNIPTEKLLDVEDHENDSGKPNKENSIVVDMDDADALKTIQLQRVLGLCEHDYDRNKDKTHYFSWGPNFKTKNHDSLGIEKEKQINKGKNNYKYGGRQGYNKKYKKRTYNHNNDSP